MRIQLTRESGENLRGYVRGLLTEVGYAAALALVALVISLAAFMVWR